MRIWQLYIKVKIDFSKLYLQVNIKSTKHRDYWFIIRTTKWIVRTASSEKPLKWVIKVNVGKKMNLNVSWKCRNKSAERLFVVTNNETANCRERIVICNRKISKFDMNIRPNSRLWFLQLFWMHTVKTCFPVDTRRRFSVYKMPMPRPRRCIDIL